MEDIRNTPVIYRPLLGEIRKIVVGDPKDGFSFTVGNFFAKADLYITCIERDENGALVFGKLIYIIWARKSNSEKEFVWKYIQDQPVMVECFTE